MLQRTAIDVSVLDSKINIPGYDKLWDGKHRSKARMMRLAKRALMPRTMVHLIIALYPTTNKVSKPTEVIAGAPESTTRLAYGSPAKSHALWPEMSDPYSSAFAQLSRTRRLPSGFTSNSTKCC